MANIASQSERKNITDYKVEVSDKKGHYDLAQLYPLQYVLISNLSMNK